MQPCFGLCFYAAKPMLPIRLSPLVPFADWDALAATLPNVRIELYPGAGHATHWEHPDRFAYDLVAFTESVVTDAHLGASLGERATA